MWPSAAVAAILYSVPVAGGDLAVALRRQGVDFEELVFPDEVHDFLIQSRWMKVFEKAADLLDRRMPAR